jgi:hypothetical protein
VGSACRDRCFPERQVLRKGKHSTLRIQRKRRAGVPEKGIHRAPPRASGVEPYPILLLELLHSPMSIQQKIDRNGAVGREGYSNSGRRTYGSCRTDSNRGTMSCAFDLLQAGSARDNQKDGRSSGGGRPIPPPAVPAREGALLKGGSCSLGPGRKSRAGNRAI